MPVNKNFSEGLFSPIPLARQSLTTLKGPGSLRPGSQGAYGMFSILKEGLAQCPLVIGPSPDRGQRLEYFLFGQAPDTVAFVGGARDGHLGARTCPVTGPKTIAQLFLLVQYGIGQFRDCLLC